MRFRDRSKSFTPPDRTGWEKVGNAVSLSKINAAKKEPGERNSPDSFVLQMVAELFTRHAKTHGIEISGEIMDAFHNFEDRRSFFQPAMIRMLMDIHRVSGIAEEKNQHCHFEREVQALVKGITTGDTEKRSLVVKCFCRYLEKICESAEPMKLTALLPQPTRNDIRCLIGPDLMYKHFLACQHLIMVLRKDTLLRTPSALHYWWARAKRDQLKEEIMAAAHQDSSTLHELAQADGDEQALRKMARAMVLPQAPIVLSQFASSLTLAVCFPR